MRGLNPLPSPCCSDGNAGCIDPVHLPCPNSHSCQILCQDDGVGFDVLHHFPGKAQLFPLCVCGSLFCNYLQLVLYQIYGVLLLQQQPPATFFKSEL